MIEFYRIFQEAGPLACQPCASREVKHMDQPPVLTSHILVQGLGDSPLLQDAGPQNFIKALNVQKVKVKWLSHV